MATTQFTTVNQIITAVQAGSLTEDEAVATLTSEPRWDYALHYYRPTMDEYETWWSMARRALAIVAQRQSAPGPASRQELPVLDCGHTDPFPMSASTGRVCGDCYDDWS